MVWDENVMPWERYGYIACSGMRCLLFRVNEVPKTHLKGITFEPKQGAQPDEIGLTSTAAAKAASGTADSLAGAAAAAGSASVAGSAVESSEDEASAADLQEIELVDAVMDVGGQASGAAAGKDQTESRLCAGAAAVAGSMGGKVIEVTAAAASIAVAQ